MKSRVSFAMAGLCLLLALVKFHAIWPYQLSRWGICAGSVWLAVKFIGWRRATAAVLAVIYNPIQPIAFGELWPWVNGLSAVALVVAGADLARASKWIGEVARDEDIRVFVFVMALATVSLGVVMLFGG